MTKAYRIISAALAVLLSLSLVLLCAHLFLKNYYKNTDTSAVLPNNHIANTSEEAKAPYIIRTNASKARAAESMAENTGKSVKLELHRGQGSDRDSFNVKNMLPGDSASKRYDVKVSHSEDVTVYFRTVVTEQTKSLSEVLCIRIINVDSGKVIYDGVISKMSQKGYEETAYADGDKETVLRYGINVYLPSSVGNEYQSSMLKCDLEWFVYDESVLIPPQTSDRGNIILHTVLAVLMTVFIIFLALGKRRKDKGYAK